jgi:hypothetical protein
MQIINTIELFEDIKKISPDGYEVFTKFGVLSSTKAIYFHNSSVFVYQINDDFNFNPEIGLTEEEFNNKYKNWVRKIEQIIR